MNTNKEKPSKHGEKNRKIKEKVRISRIKECNFMYFMLL